MKLHGEEIKAGDRVWDIIEGWGIVERIDSNNFPIVVSGHSYNSVHCRTGSLEITTYPLNH